MAAAGERFEKESFDLIRHFTGFQPNEENFKLCMQFAKSTFCFHRFLDVNRHQLQRTIEGLCDKFTVHSRKEKAVAFLSLTQRFLESEVFKHHSQLDVQYSLLALLISLANNPTDVDYDAQPNLHQLRAGEETRCEWAKLLCEKEVVESPPSDEISDWSDSDGDEVVQLEPQSHRTVERRTSSTRGPQIQGLESVITTTNRRVGRLWLKENLMPQYWKGANVVREPKREHKCNQLYRNWSNYLEDAGVVLVKNSESLLSEYQIIREVLWLLQGNRDSFLFTIDSDKNRLAGEVHVSHLTSKSLHAMLGEIATYGKIIVKFDKFVDKMSVNFNQTGKSQTLEAYATALSDYLHDFKTKMCSLEERVVKQDSIYCLSNLWDDLSPYFEEIKFLDKLHKEGVETCEPKPSERALNLLSVLYDNVHIIESFGCGCDSLVELVLRLFLKTFKPFANMVDVWISEGVLHDPHDEFFLERHAEIDWQDEEFWSGAVTIRSNISSSPRAILPSDIIHQVLQAGKSILLLHRLNGEAAVADNQSEKSQSFYETFLHNLREELTSSEIGDVDEYQVECNKDEDARNDEVAEHLHSIDESDPLLKSHFRRMIEFGKMKSSFRNSDLTINFHCPFRCPLQRAIQNAMSPFIHQKYLTNCATLISHLKRDYGLLTYLSLMRKFFLMEAGDTMFNFYSEVFDKIHDGERWKDAVLLTVMLQDNINAQYPEHATSMCVVLESVSTHAHQSIELLSGIRLRCRIPWPVNIVITNKMQRMYNQLFNFLLQVKWAKYSLDELRFQTLHHGRHAATRSVLAREQRLYLLRMHLLYFVNNVHNYIMTQSLHSTGIELENRLATASDLEQVVRAHSCYVDQLYQSCLLDNKMALVRQAILWILNLAVTFRSKWNSGVDNFSDEEISSMETELKRCVKFLTSFHGKSTKQGSFIEWLYRFVLQDWPTFT